MHDLLTERKKDFFLVLYCRAKYCINKDLMAASSNEISPQSAENSDEQSNMSISDNPQPGETQETENMPSHDFDGVYKKSSATEDEDHGGNGKRTPEGQKLEERTAGRDEQGRVYGKDDVSEKLAQHNDRFANQRGGSPEPDEKSEQLAVQNPTRFPHGSRFSNNDEQLTERGRFQADEGVAQDGKYRLYTYICELSRMRKYVIIDCIKYCRFRGIQRFCEWTTFHRRNPKSKIEFRSI